MADSINEFWLALVDIAPGHVEVDVGTRWHHRIHSSHKHCQPKEDVLVDLPWTWRADRQDTLQPPPVKFEPAGYTFEVLVRRWSILVNDREKGHLHVVETKLSYDPKGIGLR